ncbi:tRNA dimethylallyltransferase, mitochondrial [Paramarasmius palmivorus]|uniref:tRNA dimethylallyltransferase, mitochondrial n=1 Tax=Paramarasmius palmivorus TaxID=297713 RepID=A0AAW0CXL6_9AGAR
MAFRPLIAICGTTGVGKSNLAIEIALSFSHFKNLPWKGARIINADAMQVYAGMDIITNKVPLSERQGIEHLLMGFKSPTEQYVVGQWVRDALKAVEDAHNENHVPIVVGGTSYWIQHLLFPNRLVRDMATEESAGKHTSTMSEDLTRLISSLPSELLDLFNSLPDPAPDADTDPEAAYALYKLLKVVDPFVAERWHWKDTRKVLRSLRIIRETGRRPSEMIDEQSRDHVRPRFNTLCFWVYADPEVLRPRLDLRIDKMVERGMLNEVRSLREMTASNHEGNGGSDFTFGVFQSIGYREFHRYLSLQNPTEKDYQTALDNMKTSTRQYAKKQVSWLRNKLLPALYASNVEGDLSHTYLLDATDLANWNANVQDPALQITNAFLVRKPLPDPYSICDTANTMLRVEPKPTDPSAVLLARRKVICPECTIDPSQPFMVEEGKEWSDHLTSRAHKYSIRKRTQASRIEMYKRRGSQASPIKPNPEVDISTSLLER